jgi:enediyne biosynthesis protein E4
VDAVVTTNNGPVRLLLNQIGSRSHWFRIALRQPKGDPFAVGASVAVERKGQPALWRRVRTDGSYLSASDIRVHVGLGDSDTVDAIIVQWPDGAMERFPGVSAQRLVTLVRGSGR